MGVESRTIEFPENISAFSESETSVIPNSLAKSSFHKIRLGFFTGVGWTGLKNIFGNVV
jgi:hypothetical protein